MLDCMANEFSFFLFFLDDGATAWVVRMTDGIVVYVHISGMGTATVDLPRAGTG